MKSSILSALASITARMREAGVSGETPANGLPENATDFDQLVAAVKASDEQAVLNALTQVLQSGSEEEKNALYRPVNEEGDTLIHLAVKWGEGGTASQQIIRLLRLHGVPADSKDIDGRTPFSAAILMGKPIELLETLLEAPTNSDIRPADVYTVDYEGNTPLHYAATPRQSREIVELLKKHGGKDTLNQVNLNGETPLDTLLDSNSGYGGMNDYALDFVQYMVNAGADPFLAHSRPDGSEPVAKSTMDRAIDNNNGSMVNALLKPLVGKDKENAHLYMNNINYSGDPPLIYAARNGKIKAMQAMLENGFSPEYPVGKEGYPPLQTLMLLMRENFGTGLSGKSNAHNVERSLLTLIDFMTKHEMESFKYATLRVEVPGPDNTTIYKDMTLLDIALEQKNLGLLDTLISRGATGSPETTARMEDAKRAGEQLINYVRGAPYQSIMLEVLEHGLTEEIQKRIDEMVEKAKEHKDDNELNGAAAEWDAGSSLSFLRPAHTPADTRDKPDSKSVG